MPLTHSTLSHSILVITFTQLLTQLPTMLFLADDSVNPRGYDIISLGQYPVYLVP